MAERDEAFAGPTWAAACRTRRATERYPVHASHFIQDQWVGSSDTLEELHRDGRFPGYQKLVDMFGPIITWNDYKVRLEAWSDREQDLFADDEEIRRHHYTLRGDWFTELNRHCGMVMPFAAFERLFEPAERSETEEEELPPLEEKSELGSDEFEPHDIFPVPEEPTDPYEND